MIKFVEKQKRQYDILKDDVCFCSLDLITSPITNKFNKITEYIEDCSKLIGKEFDDWFYSYITQYIQSGYDSSTLRNNIDTLMQMCDKYLVLKNIKFDDYIDEKKISQNSIFFDAEEIESLIKVSSYLKLYFVIQQDSKIKLPERTHKEFYQKLTKSITSSQISFKIFKIVSSKTYRYNLTDKYMWQYINMIYCKTPDMQILHIYFFLVNNILATCDTEKNPIPYLISVIDESVKWILQSVYKDVIIYTDTINTEDNNFQQSTDNLTYYAYNDTIAKIVMAANKCLQIQNIDSTEFNDNVKRRQQTSIFSTYLTFPILQKALDIPYKHLSTLPVEHGYLLNLLVYTYIPQQLKIQYPTIFEQLLNYNKSKTIPKTTYKIKDMKHFTNEVGKFKGMKNVVFCYDRYSQIIGKIARNEYATIKGNENIKGIQLQKIETELISFYSNLFEGKLDEDIKALSQTIESLI